MTSNEGRIYIFTVSVELFSDVSCLLPSVDEGVIIVYKITSMTSETEVTNVFRELSENEQGTFLDASELLLKYVNNVIR